MQLTPSELQGSESLPEVLGPFIGLLAVAGLAALGHLIAPPPSHSVPSAALSGALRRGFGL